MGERNTASIPGNGVSLASNYAGSQNCCLTGSLPFLFLHIVLRFHARANPEPNRVGREATFYIRPLTSSLSLAVHLLVLHACLVWGGYSLPRNSQVSGTSISRLTDLSLVSLASNLEGKRTRGVVDSHNSMVSLASNYAGRRNKGVLAISIFLSFFHRSNFTLRRTLSSTGLAARPRFIPGR